MSIVQIIIAVAVYMVSFVFVSEVLNHLVKWSGGWALIASWLVGIIILSLLTLLNVIESSLPIMALFVVVTGATNSAYKFTSLKKWVRWAAEIAIR